MPRIRLIALYGSLMTGFDGQREAGVEGALTLLGPCTVEGQLFDLGRYPGLCPHPGQVQGEFHEVHDEGTLARIDAFECYDPLQPAGSLFVRRLVTLARPGREAWLYVYNRRVDAAQRIASGSWRLHRAGAG